MAEYIDREAVIEWIDYASDGYSYLETGVDFAKRDINAIPAADVVEVVRCKDCKNRHRIECFIEETGFIPPDNWFCADGEYE